MTCLEKYKQEHNGNNPTIETMCPHLSCEINIDEPKYCPGDNGLAECYDCWNREVPVTPKEAVDHPSHYNQGGIECWDAMEAAYGKEAVKAFCKLNAFKYVWRADNKNGMEDINKAINYLNKYKELVEQ